MKTKNINQIIIVLTLICALNTINAQTENTTFVTNESVDYRLIQDQYNLYVNISSEDNKTIMSILHLGVTVFFDIKGKKKQNVYIKYPFDPLRPNANRNQESSIDSYSFEEEDNRTKNRIKEIIENDLPNEAEYGYFDYKENFNILLNNLSISISYTYDLTNGKLEYHLKIPKEKINSNPKKDLSKLMIGVITNEIAHKHKKNEMQDKSFGGIGSGGGQGEGPPGGGSAGQGSPPGRGGQDQKSQQSNKKQGQAQERALNYWFKANL